MQRFLLENTQFHNTLHISDTHMYHQITKVLRMQSGDELVFFDGKNLKDHIFILQEVGKKELVFHLGESIEKDKESRRDFILYQAYPNSFTKMETIVQKCSELGYKKIVFFRAERSQKLILNAHKKNRLEKIMQEAIEQCGGNIVLEIEYCEDIGEFLISNRQRLICHTHNTLSICLGDLKKSELSQEIDIFVGPEGGFSQDEVERFSNTHSHIIYFGGRVYRLETVAPLIAFYLEQL